MGGYGIRTGRTGAIASPWFPATRCGSGDRWTCYCTPLAPVQEPRLSRAVPPDRQGFEREILAHLDVVYRTALRLSGSQSDAEDLAQETMLKALRAWRRYEPGTNARAWLLTILRNTYINRYRRTRNRPVNRNWGPGRLGGLDMAG